MTERERWIVYPLLFLALGAALRDKIIKTTHSQLITCEALCVVDKDEKPIFVLGAERYPELASGKSDFLQIDSLKASNITAGNIVGHQMRVLNAVDRERKLQGIGRLEAEVVVAGNYVLTDGEHQLPILGEYTVPLLNIYKAITTQYQNQRRSALQREIEARRNQQDTQQQQQDSQPPEQSSAEPAAESTTPPDAPTTPPAEPVTAEPSAGEPDSE